MPIIVCFSYGLNSDGGFGAVNEARCEKAARLYQRLTKRYKGRTWVVATAGTIPNFPQQKKRLGAMQREVLERLGIPCLHIWPLEIELLFWEKNVMSTVEEVKAAIEITKNRGLTQPFYAVSHWFHLPRIMWFGWWHGIFFRPTPVFSATPWRSVVAEFPKWFVALVAPFGSKRVTQWARARHIW